MPQRVVFYSLDKLAGVRNPSRKRENERETKL